MDPGSYNSSACAMNVEWNKTHVSWLTVIYCESPWIRKMLNISMDILQCIIGDV